jgi:hypothetical protein
MDWGQAFHVSIGCSSIAALRTSKGATLDADLDTGLDTDFDTDLNTEKRIGIGQTWSNSLVSGSSPKRTSFRTGCAISAVAILYIKPNQRQWSGMKSDFAMLLEILNATLVWYSTEMYGTSWSLSCWISRWFLQGTMWARLSKYHIPFWSWPPWPVFLSSKLEPFLADRLLRHMTGEVTKLQRCMGKGYSKW